MIRLALNFNKRQPGVASVLVGARNPEQLTRNLKDFNTEVPEELLDQLDVMSKDLRSKMAEC